MRDLIRIVESAMRPKMRPDAQDIARIERARDIIRRGEGGGGMCHRVSEWIESVWGWAQHSGAYVDPKDDTICDAHYWNILPDGAVLDSTADQFGEGHSVRIIEPSDPEFARYRPEWYQDYHPGHPLFPELKGRTWSGEFDGDRANRLTAERGDRVHVRLNDDLRPHRDHLQDRARAGHLHPRTDGSGTHDLHYSRTQRGDAGLRGRRPEP